MKPAPFDYVRPASLGEACTVLADAGGGATIMAGGQSLIPLLNLRMSQPFIVVDIKGLPELGGVREVPGGIRIGAAVRQADALVDPLLGARLPALVRALGQVGHQQTRNKGTIGGSVVLGEPAAEMPATAVALDAAIEAVSARGSRRIAAREFYIGPYMTAIEPDEVVTGIVYPDWADGHHVVFAELARRPGDFALTGLVGAVQCDGDIVARAGLAWFGMGPTPLAMTGLELELIGMNRTAIDPASLSNAAVAATAPFDDHHASAEYRRTVGRRLLETALRGLAQPVEAA